MVLPLLKWTWIPILPQVLLKLSLKPFCKVPPYRCHYVVVFTVVAIGLCGVVLVIAFNFESIMGPIGVLAQDLYYICKSLFMCSSFCNSCWLVQTVLAMHVRYTIFNRYIMVAVPVKVLVSVDRFPIDL